MTTTPSVPLSPEEEEKKDIAKFVAQLPVEDEPPDLLTPPDSPPGVPTVPPPTPGCTPVEKDETVISVNGFLTVLWAIITTLFITVVVFAFWNLILKSIGLQWKIVGEPQWRYPITLLITLAILIPRHRNVWTRQDPKKAKVFVDTLTKNKLVIYTGEFSLKPCWFKPFEAIPEIDLLTDVTVSGDLVIRTKDGIEVALKYELLSRPSMQNVAEHLRFSKDVVTGRIKAVMEDRLNQVFALNSWETLAKHRSRVLTWVSAIFGSDTELTAFEQHHGILISNPKLTQFEPSPEGKKIVDMLTSARILGKIIRQLHKDSPGLDQDTIQRAALRIMQVQGFIDIKASPNISTVIGDIDGAGIRGRI